MSTQNQTAPQSTAQADPYALSFSHVGLFVTDMKKMAEFYTATMGFFITDRGTLNGKKITFFSRDPREHHQIVLVEGRDHGTQLNLNQISFRLGSLGELKIFYERLVKAETAGMEPVIHGNSWSIYFHDPEGNRIEVFADTDWYISQPFKEPLDLTRPVEEIRSFTEAYCRTRNGFKPIAQWHNEMRQLMGMDA
ncbi:VOC family protein [Pacificimonas sp. ICDLI1SI03]